MARKRLSNSEIEADLRRLLGLMENLSLSDANNRSGNEAKGAVSTMKKSLHDECGSMLKSNCSHCDSSFCEQGSANQRTRAKLIKSKQKKKKGTKPVYLDCVESRFITPVNFDAGKNPLDQRNRQLSQTLTHLRRPPSCMDKEEPLSASAFGKKDFAGSDYSDKKPFVEKTTEKQNCKTSFHVAAVMDDFTNLREAVTSDKPDYKNEIGTERKGAETSISEKDVGFAEGYKANVLNKTTQSQGKAGKSRSGNSSLSRDLENQNLKEEQLSKTGYDQLLKPDLWISDPIHRQGVTLGGLSQRLDLKSAGALQSSSGFLQKQEFNTNGLLETQDSRISGQRQRLNSKAGGPVVDSNRKGGIKQRSTVIQDLSSSSAKTSGVGKSAVVAASNTQVMESNGKGPFFEPAILKEFENERIFPLKRRSFRYPKAKFFCRLCEFHCLSVDDARTHIQNTKHRWRKEISEAATQLNKLPQPLLPQLKAIQLTLLDLHKRLGLGEEDLIERVKLVEFLQQKLQKDLPGVKLHLYGSSASGFGLKTSDVNIDLEAPGGMNLALALKRSFESLQFLDALIMVRSEFSAKVPSIYFKTVDTGLQCQLTVNSMLARQTSRLLALYRSIDPRVSVLAVVFRYWAKLCKLDQQDVGTLPAYCTSLMTVYFLQQVSPPVLPVLPLGSERNEEEENVKCNFDELQKIAYQFRSFNDTWIAELWLSLLRFYCQHFDSSKIVVSIRHLSQLSRGSKNWKTKRLAIEDPFSVKRNVARSVSSGRIFEYFQDCLVKTCLYFGLPQCQHAQCHKRKPLSKCDDISAHSSPVENQKTLPLKMDPSSSSQTATTNCSSSDCANHTCDDTCSNGLLSDQDSCHLMSNKNPPRCLMQDLDFDADYEYHFTVKNLSDGRGPAIICSICGKEGHLKSACPEEVLPPLIDLPPMTDSHMKLMTETLKQVPKDFGPQQNDLKQRNSIVQELQQFLQELYPDARLHLFGSSCNGFGFHNSDLDICITFSNKATAMGLDCVKIIENLSRKLRENKKLYSVIAITTAKVPIVKFKLRFYNLEGDISLYNTLAQHNTVLLKLYTELDIRVKILGYAIKVFAKVCEIGDASKGSLSSYAYILMLLHYLQQCEPPVIPVIQELYVGMKPNMPVDGWNAWFFNDLSKLPSVWKDYDKNRQSVGELWLGLFVYYTEKFNFKEHVVTIRQLKLLTRFEKLWNRKCIAIEDPFDHSHNLGVGLSRKMNNYILKTFINGRLLYGVPVVDRVLANYQTPADYFFDGARLKEGKPPSDRCCRYCGKIGHIARDCPLVRNKKNREEQSKERKNKEKTVGSKLDERGSDMKKFGKESKNNSASNPIPQSQKAPVPGGQQVLNKFNTNVFYNSARTSRQQAHLIDKSAASVIYSQERVLPSEKQLPIGGQSWLKDGQQGHHAAAADSRFVSPAQPSVLQQGLPLNHKLVSVSRPEQFRLVGHPSSVVNLSHCMQPINSPVQPPSPCLALPLTTAYAFLPFSPAHQQAMIPMLQTRPPLTLPSPEGANQMQGQFTQPSRTQHIGYMGHQRKAREADKSLNIRMMNECVQLSTSPKHLQTSHSKQSHFQQQQS